MPSFKNEYPSWHLCQHIKTLFVESITDKELENLATCHIPLHALSLKRCQNLSVPSVLNYINSMSHSLKSLSLSGCFQLSNIDVKNISEQCINLRTLDISECTRLSDVALIHISHMFHDLEDLNIEKCNGMTDKGLISILSNLNKLQTLRVGWCDGLTDIFMHNILKAQNLSCLSISMCPKITTNGFVRFASRTSNLKEIHLGWSNFLTSNAFEILLCLLYTSPSPRDGLLSRMPSSA